MEVKLSRWQTTVWDDSHRYKVINIGRRAGKSTLSVLKTIDFAASNPKSISWMVSPTYKQTKAIAFSLFKEYLPKGLVKKVNETELRFDLINGSTIYLKGAEDADSLRGVRIDFCVFDETAFINKWDEVWKVMRPTLADSQADVWFISTPNGFNHFKDLAETKHKDWIYYHYTTYDNPYIPREEIEAMREEMDEDSFAQEVLGEFKKMTGLVYKEFSRDKHVEKIDNFPVEYWLRGCDRGFTNPTAVIYVMSDKDDNWYVVDEIYKTRLTNTLLSKELELKDSVWGVSEYELSTMDSAQAGDIAELLDFGHDFIPTTKQSGEKNTEYVRWKISKLSERLRSDKIKIHPRCENLIREFETYSYKEQRLGDSENPEKVGDHALDSLGDLNSMYDHLYVKKKKDIGRGRLKGTYVPKSVPQEDNDFFSESYDISNAF